MTVPITTSDVDKQDNQPSAEPSERTPAHTDLSGFCTWLERGDLDDSVANADELYTLAETFERMLESEERSQRLSAAEEVLRRQPLCGLAYVVLARDGGKDGSEIELLYEKGMQLLRDECDRQDQLCQSIREEDGPLVLSEPYLLESFAWKVVVPEQVRCLWSHAKKEEALEKALQFHHETAEFDMEVTPLAVSWLVQSDREQEAAELLRSHPHASEEWHYLNALMLFRQEGDTPGSRAALEEATLYEKELGTELIRNDLPAPDSFWEYQFVEDVQPTWQLFEGSCSWLKRMLEVKCPPVDFSSLPSEADAEKSDRARFKRWKDLFDHAQKLIDRKDWNEAKRLMKKALREADRFEPVGRLLERTVRQLTCVYEKTGANDDEIGIMERAQTALLRAAASRDLSNPAALIELGERADSLAERDLYEEAIAILSFIVSRYQEGLNHGEPLFDYCGLTMCYDQLGIALEAVHQYAVAESCYMRSLESQQSYLGDNHPQLALGLHRIATCLSMQRKDAEAALVRQRILQVDPYGEFDDDMLVDEDDDDDDDDEHDDEEKDDDEDEDTSPAHPSGSDIRLH